MTNAVPRDTAGYDLTDFSDRRKAEAYFEQALSESFSTWDNPETLRDIDFEDYFEPYLFETGLHNTAAAPEDLRISADQLDEAEEMFGTIKRRLWREHLVGQRDQDGTLHVVRATSKLDDSRLPRVEATYREDQAVTAEKLAASLEEEYSPAYSFTIWREREDGSLIDYYTDVEPDVVPSDLS